MQKLELEFSGNGTRHCTPYSDLEVNWTLIVGHLRSLIFLRSSILSCKKSLPAASRAADQGAVLGRFERLNAVSALFSAEKVNAFQCKSVLLDS